LRSIRFFIIGFSLAWVMSACSSPATPNAPANDTMTTPASNVAQAATTTTNDPANEGLVARVNGVGVTQADFERAVAALNNPDIASREGRQREALENLIDQELIRQGAPALGVVITADDVQAEIDSLRDLAGDNWESFLAQNNLTEAGLVTAQREQLITLGVRDVLIAPYLGEIEQVNARHILVNTRAEALTVLERLQAGEGFATLAAEYSIDSTTRDRGGNLGWFARNELFQRNLENEAFDMDIGQIRGPIETELGFHILQTMDKQVRPVERVRLPTLQDHVYTDWLEEQRANATIERYIQW
jgi:parvulin-like peptidyl-prolyl isomerase